MQPLKIVKAVAFVNPFEESDRQFDDFIAARQHDREAEERYKKDNNALGFTRAAAPKCVLCIVVYVALSVDWLVIDRAVSLSSTLPPYPLSTPPRAGAPWPRRRRRSGKAASTRSRGPRPRGRTAAAAARGWASTWAREGT